ncbi:MAG: phosphoribosylamine--glycine ligase [Peptococcaceae bacterium]|nr:phosphoribosylamine--glycine ligase [Peptococcaceae bacterium]
MRKMNVLIVGSGGREHALAWKIAQSPKVENLYCVPGNAGISRLARCFPLKAEDIPGIVAFAQEKSINLVVVGPELPLTLGLVDALEKKGIMAFGPSQRAAQIEGSKAFAKDLMHKYGIPTARYGTFTDVETARNFAREMKGPWVVKADGLAAGKGVLICTSMEETFAAIDQVLVGKNFGSAGDRLVIEEFLEGEELSLMAFCDGETVVPMVSAQDHKRVFTGDQGPNTGGMGAYSPAPVATPRLLEEAQKTILEPTVKAMAQEGRPFKGVLYAGLMITEEGPKVLEFNARFGDPETQVVLPRLENDLIEVMDAVIAGRLTEIEIKWKPEACVSVVMASGGYPGDYEQGYPITGLDQVPEGVIVFHSGTAFDGERIVTKGGRVLAVTALGADLRQAVDKAYEGVKAINFTKAHYRTDIAHRAFSR